MGKEHFGVRTHHKDGYRQAKDRLGLPDLSSTHEALMRALQNPSLPHSAATLAAFNRKEEKPEEKGAFFLYEELYYDHVLDLNETYYVKAAEKYSRWNGLQNLLEPFPRPTLYRRVYRDTAPSEGAAKP